MAVNSTDSVEEAGWQAEAPAPLGPTWGRRFRLPTPRASRFFHSFSRSPVPSSHSVVKSPAEFCVDLPRIVEVESSKGQAVIQQDASIRHIQRGQREPVFAALAKAFSQAKCRPWCAEADSPPDIACQEFRS